MKCICPKCGRKNDVSLSELRLQKGTVVCPRCLTTFKIQVPKEDDEETPPPIPTTKRSSSGSSTSKPRRNVSTAASSTPARFCTCCGSTVPAGRTTCPECGHKVASATTPQRRTISFTDSDSKPTKSRSSSSAQPYSAPTRKSSSQKSSSKPKKKQKNEEEDQGFSWLKTVCNTILIVVIFFAIYFILGVLFS